MRRSAGVVLGLLSALTFSVAPVGAQTPESGAWLVFRQVVLDPTTYAPAVVSYTAERLDWSSSQVFFDRGYVEQNSQFTISGFPSDLPLSYSAGKGVITTNALADLGSSVVNNVTTRVIERVLLKRYPEKKTLIRTLGWIERISFAATLASRQSAGHFHQWRRNIRLAGELGFR